MRFSPPQTLAKSPDPAPPLAGDPDVRVLVVDDQASNLEAIDALLGQTDYQLVRAQSANDALLHLLEHEFAAIILDIKMPGMNGLELAQLIKQRRRTRHVPILFLTAHMMDERDVLQGYGTGAVDYLTKPVHGDILRSKVAVFVELFRKSRDLGLANAALQKEIVERERAEDALRAMNHELESRVQERTDALQRADRRKDEFLASLAHELRNPLAPIRAAVEVLQLTQPEAGPGGAARAVIVRQLDHMTRLIGDLLDVSRITVDKLVLQIDQVALAPIIASAVETSRPLIDERRHALNVQLHAGTITVDADPARLSQVLSNLLNNAARYTAPNGRIDLSAAVEGDEVVVRVADTGQGIEADLLPGIFELFAQGRNPRDRSTGGLGIGLTLARRLVDMHGGRLEVRSGGPGLGSEFTVRLPLSVRRAVDRPEEEVESPLPGSRRLLIVDDNRDAADMLASLLTAWRQEVQIAYDGRSALEIAEQFLPDVVLLDIGLPELDGYETARRIRRFEWGPRALLVGITGWGQEADIARGRDAGFDHHLVKPVAPRLLRSVLAAHRIS